MWQCTKCREKLEDGFDVCWNCGTARDGSEDPSFRRENDSADSAACRSAAESQSSDFESPRAVARNIPCKYCGVATAFLGQIALMKNRESLLMAFVAALSSRDTANLEAFPVDIFRCPKCGRLDLYDLDFSLPTAE